jgi:hypothetical protein
MPSEVGYANPARSRPYDRHGSEAPRFEAELHPRQLVPKILPHLITKLPEVAERCSEPHNWLVGHQ